MESYLEFMEELSIPEKDRRKIMWENTARLFRLKVTEIGGTASAFRGIFT
jgi:predicted TIM-barrel fold metal-dependent hydrolase